MMLGGCAITCEPTGKILWTGNLPGRSLQVSELVDGVMGGVSCQYRIDGDRR